MKFLLRLRGALARAISRKMLPDSFSIISDDCWGGQLYRQLGLQYTTPTVGLWVEQKDYMTFLEKLHNKDVPALEFLPTERGCPVARCLDSTIYFMHYENEEEVMAKFPKRFDRIDWNKVLVKVDFGKPGFGVHDIDKWNEMQIPNSIAFYSERTELPESGIFNGILVPDWIIDGAALFDITRKHFDLFDWVRNGNISNRPAYKFWNFLLFDPSAPSRMVNRRARAVTSRV